MKVVIAIVHFLIIFSLSYYWWKSTSTSIRKVYWPALFAKLFAGLALGWIYTSYYTVGDTFTYFNDGMLLANIARQDPGEYITFLWSGDRAHPLWSQLHFADPRAVFMVKVVSIFNLVTFDSYWLTSLYFSWISFVAAWFLVQRIANTIPECIVPSIIAFLFFPSIVFWSSGVIKESVASFALYYLTGLFIAIWFNEKVKMLHIPVAMVAAWVLWILKYYFAAIFFPVLIAGIAYKYILDPLLHPRTPARQILVWLLIFAIPLFLVSFFHGNFYPERFLGVIVSNYKIFHQVSAQKDLITFYNLTDNVWSVILNAPMALLSGLFRPFLWEAGNAFQLISAIENTFLLLVFVAALKNLKNAVRSMHRILIVSLIFYVALLCIFITLSTPNFGTLSRYRVGYLPFFVFMIFCHNPVTDLIMRKFPRLVR